MGVFVEFRYRDLSKVWRFYVKKYMDKGCSEIKAHSIAAKVMRRKRLI